MQATRRTLMAASSRGIKPCISAARSFNHGLPSAATLRFFASYPAHTKITMPALSPTMKTGTIAKWEKKEGDELKPGDAVAEVETDKATVTFECQDDGYLAKILRADGSTDVGVGEVIAIMVDTKDAVAAFKDYVVEGAAVAAPTSAPAPAAKPVAAPAPTASAPKAAATAAPAAKPMPVSAPKASAPTAVSAAAPPAGGVYVTFDAWGTTLKRTLVGLALAKSQNAYAQMFGYSGFDPIPLPEDPKAKKEAPVKAPKV